MSPYICEKCDYTSTRLASFRMRRDRYYCLNCISIIDEEESLNALSQRTNNSIQSDFKLSLNEKGKKHLMKEGGLSETHFDCLLEDFYDENPICAKLLATRMERRRKLSFSLIKCINPKLMCIHCQIIKNKLKDIGVD